VSAGVDIEMVRMTFADLCDEYLLKGWKGKDGGRTYHVAWWREQLGKHIAQKLTKQQVKAALREFRAGKARRGNGVEANGKKKTIEMDRPRSPATHNRILAALKAIMKYGREECDLSNDPCKDIAKLTEDNKRTRWLDDEERTALLKACKESEWERLHLLVAMALTSGARLSEMLNLKYADLDLPNGRAVLHETKNGESRNIHLAPEIVAEIKTLTSPDLPENMYYLIFLTFFRGDVDLGPLFLLATP